ncbi:hypothetical protein [Parasphingopyxis lamellibrachiae]|uniref:hypothetical protein n=1 Tax=Parasphingopyxis lamellibrachiae TaxID=680125 RepID=UPI000E2634AB|nr:hypothetical protein [Parasphingopyxis lamellibrachiae]
MNNSTCKSPTAQVGDLSQPETESKLFSGLGLSQYLSNLNKLRDIYIDSSLFRNPVWEIFLSLYNQRQEHLQVTLVSLSAGNRLSEAECASAVESLVDAGLVVLGTSKDHSGPQVVDLTEQGRQRMAAFLGSAERARN